MDKASLEALQLDRRLVGRRGWISAADLERELAALPDVSDKIATEAEAQPEPAADAPPAPSAEAAPEPGEA